MNSGSFVTQNREVNWTKLVWPGNSVIVPFLSRVKKDKSQVLRMWRRAHSAGHMETGQMEGADMGNSDLYSYSD
jgi:hypothetical protein